MKKWEIDKIMDRKDIIVKRIENLIREIIKEHFDNIKNSEYRIELAKIVINPYKKWYKGIFDEKKICCEQQLPRVKIYRKDRCGCIIEHCDGFVCTCCRRFYYSFR